MGRAEWTFGFSAIAVTIIVGLLGETARAQWLQWGGPNRNFTVETSGLADKWPDGGPKKIWHRQLGVGYSSIVVDGGVLYTMYRKEPTAEDEFTIALDAQTGKTIWEHKNPAPPHERPNERWGGQGPNATPLVVGDRLFAIGSHAVMHSFNKMSGEVIWRRDLAKDFSPSFSKKISTGYSASPIAYKDMVIVPIGRAAESTMEAAGELLVAFEQSTGKVVWKSLDLLTPLSSPILTRFHGEEHLVLYAKPGLVGVDPSSGSVLWSHAVKEPGAIQTPVWSKNGLIFCGVSEGDHVGSVVKLEREDARTVASELWTNRKVRTSLATPVQKNGHLYAGTEQGVISVDIASGKRDWLARGFPTPSFVHGDGRLIILDQDGNLTLATPKPEKLIVHSKCKVTERYSLTAPTLAGTTLYVRDRKHIMAFDLAG